MTELRFDELHRYSDTDPEKVELEYLGQKRNTTVQKTYYVKYNETARFEKCRSYQEASQIARAMVLAGRTNVMLVINFELATTEEQNLNSQEKA